MPAGIFYIADTMKQGPCIDCGESRLRSALKIAGGSLSGGGSLGGPSLYIGVGGHSECRRFHLCHTFCFRTDLNRELAQLS